jgi:hypothetical protein
VVDREEARAWMERWKIVNEFTMNEVRALTPEQKFEQLELLVASADLFPQPVDDEEENQRVRDLWMRLHAHYRS